MRYGNVLKESNNMYFIDIYDLDSSFLLKHFSCDICNKKSQCQKISCAITEKIHDSGLDICHEHRGFDEFGHDYQYFVQNNPKNKAIIDKLYTEFCK